MPTDTQQEGLPPSDFLTLCQLARRWGVTVDNLRLYITDGSLSAWRLPGKRAHWRVSAHEVRRIEAGGSVPGQRPRSDSALAIIRQAVADRGWSAADLERHGLSHGAAWRLVSGRSVRIEWHTLDRVLAALGLAIREGPGGR